MSDLFNLSFDEKICEEKITAVWHLLKDLDNGSAINVLTACLCGFLDTMHASIRDEARAFVIEFIEDAGKKSVGMEGERKNE